MYDLHGDFQGKRIEIPYSNKGDPIKFSVHISKADHAERFEIELPYFSPSCRRVNLASNVSSTTLFLMNRRLLFYVKYRSRQISEVQMRIFLKLRQI